MIVTCNYEEIVALEEGGRAFLAQTGGRDSSVAAPSAGRAAVESLLPRLTGDLSIRTMADQQELERAARTIVGHLRQEMEALVVAIHPAAEETVAAYFEFAHALAFLGRVQEAGREMRALIEVMTGRPPNRETLHTFQFPD